MQYMLAANQAQISGARGTDPPAPRREQPTCATTTTTAINSTARCYPNASTAGANKGSEPHDTTIQVVMPNPNDGRGNDGQHRRGRGRE